MAKGEFVTKKSVRAVKERVGRYWPPPKKLETKEHQRISRLAGVPRQMTTRLL
jgi:hypothetical protein